MCFFRHAGRCQSGWPGKKVTLAKKGQVTLQTKFKFAIVQWRTRTKVVKKIGGALSPTNLCQAYLY